jgi:7-carboxy-7-deazaguanine synthase
LAKQYSVREIFDTFQGEGSRAGTRAVFIRFSGCNMWNGRPADREKGAGACADWCDTDFEVRKSLRLTAEQICSKAHDLWGTPGERLVVLTGGEPLLQVDWPLVNELRDWGFKLAVETNGTVHPLAFESVKLVDVFDHVCVSPKLTRVGRFDNLTVLHAHDLKVVLPGSTSPDIPPWSDDELAELAKMGTWKNLYVQPIDPVNPGLVDASLLRRNTLLADGGKGFDAATKRCLEWVKENPSWRLGVQLHKFLNLP